MSLVLPAMAVLAVAVTVPPVMIGPKDTPNEIIRKAASVVPTPRQAAWQELEFTGFVHFGMNTFTNREWGDGKEDPKQFNPTAFDASQWARAAKAAGMTMLILPCKHHDGFCLWPSKYTEHSVKNSPWKNGKGDIVREVADACRAASLKFGVYLSPWDRHEPTYGDSPRYNEYFKNQLRELLTGYGDIAEVWFDGANGEGPNGRRQVYDWKGTFELVRELAPNASISISGPDVRWCGNEAGKTRESEWSVVPIQPGDGTPAIDCRKADLGSRQMLIEAAQKGMRLAWYPAQVDTSIRPGWFYHPSEDGVVKSLKQLLDIYYGSVGGNAQLLLNIPPDKRGLMHENDVRRLTELGRVLRQTFAKDFARGAKATASNVRGGDSRFSAMRTIDDDATTFWATDDGVTSAMLEYGLPAPRTFNVAMLQEPIRHGQTIEEFHLDAWTGGGWKEVGRGTVVGYKRLVRFPEVTSSKVRVRITNSRVSIALANFGLFLAPVVATAPVIRRDRKGLVTIDAPTDVRVRYTTDGRAPTATSAGYVKPFPMAKGGLVRAQSTAPGIVFHTAEGPYTEYEFGIASANWRVVSCSGNTKCGDAAIDGDPTTTWFVDGSGPKEIVVDLGNTTEIKGFTYLPRQDGRQPGIVRRYAFYVSPDGKSWGTPAAEGEFANILNNPILQRVRFPQSVRARFIRFVGLSGASGGNAAGIAELGILDGTMIK